jgi:hypothetical protein
MHIGSRLVGACLASLVITESNAQSADFVELFDGTLNGWTVENSDAGNFRVEDGFLRVEAPEGWLRHERRLGDFDLIVEFRFLSDDADSGFFFRVAGDGFFSRGWPNRSYQVQLRNPLGESSFPPVGGLFRHGMPAGQTSFDESAVRRVALGTGEWQRLEIRVSGQTVRASLNGTKVLRAEGTGNGSGYIGLQGETGGLDFRSIRMRDRSPP